MAFPGSSCCKAQQEQESPTQPLTGLGQICTAIGIGCGVAFALMPTDSLRNVSQNVLKVLIVPYCASAPPCASRLNSGCRLQALLTNVCMDMHGCMHACSMRACVCVYVCM